MQHAQCFVQLSGDLGTSIAKAPVTPAEVVLLRAIHGPDAVSKVVLLRGGTNDKTSHAEEMQRLRDHYTAMTDDGKPVIDKVFPGHAPQLPTTFKEIGVDLSDSDDDAPHTADTDGDGVLSVAELKTELTAMGVTFKGNASRKTLGALYDDALEASKNDDKSED